MPNEVQRTAGGVVSIDSVVIAKIRNFRLNITTDEQDVSGIEDVSGDLVDKQFLTTAIDTTIDFGGIVVSGEGEGTPQALSPGQQDARDAALLGTIVTVSEESPSGYGYAYTGPILSWTEEYAEVTGVRTFSASMRVNSKVAVTP